MEYPAWAMEVEPFAVKRFGTTFGLIVDAPENKDDIWWVTAEPGDYMAFSAPWDSGEYDTRYPQQQLHGVATRCVG
jgi:hypothetical protein